METVFITIHDLSLDARIKYCSDSVEDILGYLPHEVKGKSCWEYFHPDEIPFARAIHGRGVDLDKAAALNYCRIKHKDGHWVGCECVFTVVYDVLVASTSIYQRGPKAQKRALDGAGVRRIFSTSPRDPRYHMLSYISNKFIQESQPHSREPRAALFLNRFTRTANIMFATNGVANILGLQPNQLVGKSFYYCIAENCLSDAVRCLESAKGNDSIAYLRFWFRDPMQEEPRLADNLSDSASSDEDDEGGVRIRPGLTTESSVEMTSPPLVDGDRTPRATSSSTPQTDGEMVPRVDGASHPQTNGHSLHAQRIDHQSRTSSDDSTDLDGHARDSIFDPPALHPQSSASSVSPPEDSSENSGVEVEAVVSCTSDGLVVVLRRARPLVPQTASLTETRSRPNGLFASPWALQPVMPPNMAQTTLSPAIAPYPAMSEPTEAGFMSAIRDVAVFAWSLTGINGALVDLAHGKPSGEALPPGGLPVWDPNATSGVDERWNGFSGGTHRPIDGMGDPVQKKDEELTSSDDEVVWKRVPQMPAFRRPKRRDHQDAFGTDGVDHEPKEDTDRRDSQRRRLDGWK